MTEYSITSSRGAGGCGCGGGGSSCGCGGSSSCTMTGDGCMMGPLQRPAFFSGQLLTEEDLQQLSDYAATKSRLHNRFLHGAGVVCGLQVTCNPCGGGKVTVQPGTALDCCGNDIHVPCAVELDINKMVNALRIELRGGHDCGDPCEQPCDDSPDDTRCLDRKGRRYDLYVRYCETPVEPVTPYVTGGDCAPQQCKPTRINEGYRFELRCRASEKPPEDIFKRLMNCLGDLVQTEKVATDAYAIDLYGRKQAAVRQHVETNSAMTFASEDVSALKRSEELRSVASFEAAPADDAKVGGMLDGYLSSSAAILRYDLQDEARKAALEEETPGLAAMVEEARATLQSSAPSLRKRAQAIGSARTRTIAEAWLEQGTRFLSGAPDANAANSAELRSYALEAPRSDDIAKRMQVDLKAWRDWLVERVEAKSLSTDCRLRADIYAIVLPQDGEQRDAQFEEATEQLKDMTIRYVVDCICAALNPPCQPCEDDAVKLAGLTVEDCDVTRICNLERTFVLSGPALRYWVPFLHMIGELFERACCDLLYARPWKKRRVPDPQTPSPPPPPPGTAAEQPMMNVAYMKETAPVVGMNANAGVALDKLFRIAGIDGQAAMSRINAVTSMARVALPTDRIIGTVEDGGAALAERARSSVIDIMKSDDKVRAALVQPVSDELVALRSKVDLVAKDAKEAATAADVTVLREQVEKVTANAAGTNALAAEVTALRSRIDVVVNEAPDGSALGRTIEEVNARISALDDRIGALSSAEDMRKALSAQREVSEALATRLARLEASGGTDDPGTAGPTGRVPKNLRKGG